MKNFIPTARTKAMLRFMCIICLGFLSVIANISNVMAANPLGFEIGKAHYDDIKKRLSAVVHLRNQGINKYSGGKMIVADEPETLGYDGLQKVTFIFDNTNILTAVIMRLSRSENGERDTGFLYAYKRLSEKYLPVFKNLNASGRMSAGFTTASKDVHIRMLAMRLSDNFDLQYFSDTFWQRYENNKKSSDNVRLSAQYGGLVKESLF